MAREKILVVDHDLNNLSRMYLAFIHRKFKAEACNDPQEIMERIKRFRPAVIVLGAQQYSVIRERLRIPAVILQETGAARTPLNLGDVALAKPVPVDTLIKTVETLV